MIIISLKVRETRKAVHDSESGTRKMAIGHHIGKHHFERKRGGEGEG